ncbi:hypothetical protein EOPP23_12710 [Endozoicomonas sp. OPT23]|uniref:tetratricopeptide repeat protein n=1 Tax=Endozoicomonas sp. OPT23 TaxID=2072845 RepID=UPI00129B23B0|nr:hypothetical protein [Endozoicomonas sp. OPT23]MRI33848.1 hypothetical protein [Endozoicomonas sp. OPT23]
MDTGSTKPSGATGGITPPQTPGIQSEKKQGTTSKVESGAPIGHRKTDKLSSETTRFRESFEARLTVATERFTRAEKPSLSEFRVLLQRRDGPTAALMPDEYLKELLALTPKESFSRYSPEHLNSMATDVRKYPGRSIEERMNNRFSLYILSVWRGDEKEAKSVLKELLNFPSEMLEINLQAIEIYQKLAKSKKTLKSHGQLDNAVRLAIDSQFTPLVVLLTRMACRTATGSGVSQGYLVELLACCTDRNHMLNIAQPLALEMIDLAFIRGVREAVEPASESAHLLWLLISSAMEERREPLNNTPFTGTLNKHLWTMLGIALTGYKAGSLEKLRDTYFRSAKDAPTDRDRKKSRFGLKESSLLKAADFIEERSKGQTEFVKAVIELTLGHYFKYQYFLNTEEDPKAAEHFLKAADSGPFPLLYIEAANIYSGRADYDQAIVCLNNALKVRGMPQVLTGTIQNQLDLYRQKRDEIRAVREQIFHEFTDQASSKPRSEKKERRKKKNKSHHSGAEVTPESKPLEAVTRTFIEETTPEPSHSLTRSAHTFSQDDGTECESNQGDDATVEVPRPPAESAKSILTISETEFVFEGWLPDQNRRVMIMIDKVNEYREKENSRSEFQYLNRLLKKGDNDFFGRLQEEKGWSFLRMADCPRFQLGTPRVEKRRLISEWLGQAEHCFTEAAASYLGDYIPDPIKPDPFLDTVEKRYTRTPELRGNAEYRKRMRSLCSSFGHLYSHKARMAGEGQREKLGDIATDFYNLKVKVDPDYVPDSVAEPVTKLRSVSSKKNA